MNSESGTVLYISYDGLLEPLGESQVLQYLEVLAETHKIVLLTYEKPKDWGNLERRRTFFQRLEGCGIKWIPCKYHKAPAGLATAYDITRGLLLALYVRIRYRIQIVHARSYVPSVIALFLKRLSGTSFIFDMRGFWPDERVNAGQWSHDSAIYKIAKWFERRFLLEADIVVSLTNAAVREIRKLPYLDGRLPDFQVIPTCVNMSLFTPARATGDRENIGSCPDRFILGCVGSVDGWFRFDAVLRLFGKILEKEPESRLVILNRGHHEFISESARHSGIPRECLDVKAVEYESVPKEMATMSAGVFFYQPSYSELARSPTKMGEFLSCGVPCITNRGIGDSEEILDENNVGVVLADLTNEQFDWAATQILKLVHRGSIQTDCVRTAEEFYSLSSGVKLYDDSYKKVLAWRSAAS